MQRMTRADIHPHSRLSPDRVIAAVEALGLACDGRVLALNSYENRVYQVGLEDAEPVVVKFYRPGRWSLAALHEEHAFAAELAAAEVPVVAPLVSPVCFARVPAVVTPARYRRSRHSRSVELRPTRVATRSLISTDWAPTLRRVRSRSCRSCCLELPEAKSLPTKYL